MSTAGQPPRDETEERSAAVRGLEQAFSELMSEWRRVLSTAAEAVHPGLLPGSYKVLSVLERIGGAATLSVLSERLGADKGLISRSVSELEEAGLVARTPDPRDGRVRVIQPTERGTQRLAAARALYEDRLTITLGEWPLESVTLLTKLVSALVGGASPVSQADADASCPGPQD